MAGHCEQDSCLIEPLPIHQKLGRFEWWGSLRCGRAVDSVILAF
eukprot:SAG31_NODE_32460_length_355_cov_1.406250_1_plen_43_part_10